MLFAGTRTLTDTEITDLRHRCIGFISQSFNLPGKHASSRTGRREWVEHLIHEVGLADWRKHRPNELSGGNGNASRSRGRS